MIVAVTILVIAIKENRLSEEVQKLEGKTIDENPIENIDDKQEMPKEVKRSLYFLLASIFLWFTAYNAVITAFSRYATKVWGNGRWKLC